MKFRQLLHAVFFHVSYLQINVFNIYGVKDSSAVAENWRYASVRLFVILVSCC